MKFSDINPFVRYAANVSIDSSIPECGVYDCRIWYLKSGKITVFINNSSVTLEKNSVFFCNAGSIYSISIEQKAKLVAINFDLTQSASTVINPFAPVKLKNFNKSKVLSPEKIENSILESFAVLNDAGALYHIIEKIVCEFSNHKIFYREKSSSLLKELLVEMHRENIFKTTNSTDAVNTVLKFIENNYQSHLTNYSLAKLVGYHEYYLSKMFSRHTGLSLHKYIINYRLNKAKELLTCTPYSIDVISEKVGFSGDAAFSSSFKKSFGITPTEYRQLYKNMI